MRTAGIEVCGTKPMKRSPKIRQKHRSGKVNLIMICLNEKVYSRKGKG